MLCNVKYIIRKCLIVFFVEVFFIDYTSVAVSFVILCQSLQRGIDKENNLVRAVLYRLFHHINGIRVL